MANEFKIKNGLISDGDVVVTGSLTVTGTINMSGSIESAETASFAPSYTLTSSFNSYTSSASSSVGLLSSSVATTTSDLSSSIGNLSGSVATTTLNLSSSVSSSIGNLSGSVATTTSGLGGRITTIEGNYATTGSNIFVGSQVITGSLYITNDMVVQGCSCLQNITASAVSIGTNVVMLNTATPAVRFAGISVQDSGSNAGVTGSIFWDGLCNKWIYSNPSTVGYTGGMLISGPRNTGTIGNETPLTCNYVAKSGGGDHIYDSCIIDDGTTVCVKANLGGVGTASFSSTITAGGNIQTDGGSNKYIKSTGFISNQLGQLSDFGETDAGFYITAGGGMQFVSTGANRMFIASGGNIGVGTVSPASKFHICGSSNDIGLRMTNTTANKTYMSYSDTSCNYIIYDVSKDSNRMTIFDDGQVSFVCQVCVPNIISTGASGGRYGTFNAPTNGGYITFEAGGTPFGDLGSYCAQYGTGDATTLLLGSRTGYALSLGTNSAERVRITSDGYVAITGNQGLKCVPYLQGMSFGWNRTNGQGESMINWTNAGGGTSCDLTFNFRDSSTLYERLRITSEGKVGIGTNSPTTKLEVIGGTSNVNGYADGTIQVTGLNPIAFVATSNLNPSLNRWGFVLREVTDGDFSIRNYRQSTTPLIIKDDGKIGIGTTSPSNLLTVVQSTSGNIAYFGQAPTNASSLNALIQLQSGTIPQSGGDTTGQAGLVFTHSYGTGGVNGSACGGYIKSIRSDVFGVTSQACTALVFATSTSNVECERMRISSNGTVLIGTTCNCWNTTFKTIQIGNTSINNINNQSQLVNNIYYDGIAYKHLTNAGANRFIMTTSGYFQFETAVSANVGCSSSLKTMLSITDTGNVLPGCNGTQDLGSSSLRWCTVYTSDLSLNNGIGNYTIVEGESDLFIYNNNSCKVYKFLLQEVCKECAPAKRSI